MAVSVGGFECETDGVLVAVRVTECVTGRDALMVTVPDQLLDVVAVLNREEETDGDGDNVVR